MQNNLSEAVDIVLNQNLRASSSEAPVKQNFNSGQMPFWKRCLDISIILLSAPATLLVGLVIALMIKLGSRGPVIFKQERVGYKGRKFVCYKFRSMHTNAEINSHRGHTANLIKSEAPMTKLDAKRDPRIIPGGTILRATGLDELPQLLNVLRGEMSIVGPRPCVQYEYDMYESWQKRRFDAVPGLTGLWQVSGKNRTTFTQMINFDIEYSERASLWLDLQIIAKTIPALIGQCLDQRRQRRNTQTGATTVTPVTVASTDSVGSSYKVAA